MKRTCYLLVPVWLVLSGCITLPGGEKNTAKLDAPKFVPTGFTNTPAPEPVDPEDVTLKNLELKTRDLEAEIRYDERNP